MKACPVCKATAFDDAEVCYGCLHRFEEQESQAPVRVNARPEFLIRFVPVMESTGEMTWNCTIEQG